jgi:hypothetical protein
MMMDGIALAQAFLEDVLGAGMAFPAIVCDAEVVAKFRHRCDAIADCLVNSSFGYIIADTNNHDIPVRKLLIAMLTDCPT